MVGSGNIKKVTFLGVSTGLQSGILVVHNFPVYSFLVEYRNNVLPMSRTIEFSTIVQS